jgi:predicted MFS family arabinose efflux permease
MTRSLMVLFAIAGGAAVGSLYYAQPLLDIIARDLHVPQGSAGLLVMAAQIGYAVGILFIVPLGDLRDRRRLVPLMMLLSAIALAACSIAPGIGSLTIMLVAVGVTTVSGQILAPLAGDLSDDASRGKVVGIVMSGIITGILVARILSGVIANLAGWRVVFLVAAGIAVILSGLLYRSIPRIPPKAATLSYGALLRSVLSLVVRERTLQVTMVLGAIGFAVFTMFWTSLTFLLSNPPYGFSTSVIGLFGVAGLVGALAAQGAGRVHDRGWSTWGTGAAWLLVLAGFLAAGSGAHVLAVLLPGIVVLDAGIQAQHIFNQSRLFQLAPDARSRVNTAYIGGNFIGGTLGSLIATVLWAAGGWSAVTGVGAALSAVALCLWAFTRNGALRAVRPEPSPVPSC